MIRLSEVLQRMENELVLAQSEGWSRDACVEVVMTLAMRWNAYVPPTMDVAVSHLDAAPKLAELLAAAKTIASFAVSWQPLTPGDIKELTDAIAKAE